MGSPVLLLLRIALLVVRKFVVPLEIWSCCGRSLERVVVYDPLVDWMFLFGCALSSARNWRGSSESFEVLRNDQVDGSHESGIEKSANAMNYSNVSNPAFDSSLPSAVFALRVTPNSASVKCRVGAKLTNLTFLVKKASYCGIVRVIPMTHHRQMSHLVHRAKSRSKRRTNFVATSASSKFQ